MPHVALFHKTPLEGIDAPLALLSEQIAWLVAQGWEETTIKTYIQLFDTDEEIFNCLIDDIDAGKINTVFVFSIDRLFPEVELGLFINTCQSCNVEVITPVEKYDLSDSADLQKFREHHDAYLNYARYRDTLKAMCECWEVLKATQRVAI